MARVLVIDDDPIVRTLVSNLLEARGHDVSVAADGRLGMKAIEASGAYDLIITDMVMPNQEGMETIVAIRRSHPRIPVLAISGSRTVGQRGDYLDAARMFGAAATLPKPIVPEVLVEAVERLLGKASS